MYAVRYFSRWNGFFNEYEYKYFETLEEAQEFAKDAYNPTFYKQVPSPAYMNSKYMLEEIK